jgi:hypothetical protein
MVANNLVSLNRGDNATRLRQLQDQQREVVDQLKSIDQKPLGFLEKPRLERQNQELTQQIEELGGKPVGADEKDNDLFNAGGLQAGNNNGGGGLAPTGNSAGGLNPGGAGGMQPAGAGGMQPGTAVHTKVNPDGTTETTTTPAGQPGPWKGDPFAVDSDGDGKFTMLGDDKGKVTIDDGTGNGPMEVNKWKDDMLFQDKNGDGKFQADEIQNTKDPESIKKSGFDKNNDGKIDQEEAKAGNLKFVSYDDNGKEQVRGFGEEGPGGKPGIKSFGYNLDKKAQQGTQGIEEKGRATAEFTNGKTADTINFDFVVDPSTQRRRQSA